jgi:hypothetical protein
VNVRFACPGCEQTARAELAGPVEWTCPACDHLLRLPATADAPAHACAVCGNPELYRKKDFPHGLGIGILALACLGSVIPYALHRPGWTWAILIGSAVLDGLLYLCVGDVSVCYRCGAEHRGLPAGVKHPPFELSIAERYRQEKIRREGLKKY